MKEQEVMSKYKIDPQDLKTFAEKNYPQFAQNTTVLIQLYLAAKNIQPDPQDFQVISGEKKTINELEISDWAVLEVLVGPRIRSNSYSGCPVCGKKVEGQYCNECGKVEPVINWFDNYQVGDNTGDVPMVLGPRFANSRKLLTGKVVHAKGQFSQQGEFVVSALEEVGGVAISIGREEKPEQGAVGSDKDALAKVLSEFPQLRLVDVKKWAAAQSPPITTELEPIITDLGYAITNGIISKPKPAEQPSTDQTIQPPAVVPATTAQPAQSPAELADVGKLRKLTTVFSSIALKDLKNWHKKEKLSTSLEKLLEKIPHTSEGSGEEIIYKFPAEEENA